MQSYQINDLERLTGIKAHTIRIWEKRYGLIEPDRTTTNRRTYNESQVKKLLNVSTLLAQGQKISKIAALNEDEINEQIQNDSKSTSTDNIITSYIADLVKAMVSFDEAAFEKIFAASVTRFGMYEAILNVVYPFLNKVGILWCASKAAPAQEHFATSIVRRKLMAATDGLMPPADKTKKFLLFLPEQEWHEIGLLFANYIIRSRGYETIYLGQNVPFENVAMTTSVTNCGFILLFYITVRPAEEIEKKVMAFAKINPGTHVLVACNEAIAPPEKSKAKNITYLTEVNTLFNYL